MGPCISPCFIDSHLRFDPKSYLNKQINKHLTFLICNNSLQNTDGSVVVNTVAVSPSLSMSWRLGCPWIDRCGQSPITAMTLAASEVQTNVSPQLRKIA